MVGRPRRFAAAFVGSGRAVRDGGDLGRSTAKPGAQPLPGRLGHHDDLVSARHDLLEHRTLLWRRVFAARCGRPRSTGPQAVHDVDDFVTVGAAVDAVLVLDDGDITLVEKVERMLRPTAPNR